MGVNFIVVFMQLAVQLALDNVNANTGGPFGAVVVKDGVIIGVGQNHVTKLKDPTAHAEVQAIREACHYLNSINWKAVKFIQVVNHAQCAYVPFTGLGQRLCIFPPQKKKRQKLALRTNSSMNSS